MLAKQPGAERQLKEKTNLKVKLLKLNMMRKMIMAIAAMLITAGATAQENNQAQRGQENRLDRTEMIKNRTDETVKKYGLNEEQAKKLLEANTKYADKFPSPRGFMGGPRGGQGGQRGGGFGADRRERPSMRDGQRPQLTEEQRAQFESRRKMQEEAMKEYDAELQKIMTPEQYKAYQADQLKQRESRGRRGGQFGGGQRRGPRDQQQ